MTDSTNPYKPPMSNVGTGAVPGNLQMPLKDIYLSLQGRIPRKTFWIYGILLQMVGTMVVFGVIAGIGAITSDVVGMILMVPAYLAAAWAGFAVQVKRWHDRDKSGWWILISLIPLIGAIWAIVETGFLRGTVGENRFGDDPTEAS